MSGTIAPIPFHGLAEVCRRRRIRELAIFGSALGERFGPQSDIDVIIEFELDARPTLFTLDVVQAELESLFGRPVDLLTKGSILRSQNAERREAILRSARVLYAA